jgi:hypothetical protein
MKELILFVGPPGSGKSTNALMDFHTNSFDTVYINQDSQGKEGHKKLFAEAISNGSSIIVDRMNFNKEQRYRYLIPAIDAGYKTRIVVLHESFETCFKRCIERKNHETIKDEKDASRALNFFFTHYERVDDSEAVEVIRIWPEGNKQKAIICDLDGTLTNCEHRRHFVNPDVKPEGFKRNWKAFFEGMVDDSVNLPVHQTIVALKHLGYETVYCSGRPDNYRKETLTWLKKYCNQTPEYLFMRNRNDQRPDNFIKEIIYEFELKTRFDILLVLDDRQQVVDMWRKHKLACFQVQPGDF